MTPPDDKAIEAALQAFWDTETEGSGLDDMRRAIAAYEAALWQPIESAPRDGTTLIGWFDEFDEQLTIIWSDTRGGSWRLASMGSVELGDWGQPMRWRPLPAPPEPAPDAPESRSCDGTPGATADGERKW